MEGLCFFSSRFIFHVVHAVITVFCHIGSTVCGQSIRIPYILARNTNGCSEFAIHLDDVHKDFVFSKAEINGLCRIFIVHSNRFGFSVGFPCRTPAGCKEGCGHEQDQRQGSDTLSDVFHADFLPHTLMISQHKLVISINRAFCQFFRIYFCNRQLSKRQGGGLWPPCLFFRIKNIG